MMADCTYWKILSAAELGRMLCSGLGRVCLFSAVNMHIVFQKAVVFHPLSRLLL